MSNNYKAFMSSKQPISIMDCPTSYEAQKRAAAVWGVKPKNQHKITIVLCESEGKAVIHNPAEFG